MDLAAFGAVVAPPPEGGFSLLESVATIRNIGTEIESQLHQCDLVILEGSSSRSNLAFEIGFARRADIPVIVL
ncbi:hypothetical protein ACQPZ8_43675 [Actinomadura nitritigenes]|uniref:hypothetical protein n=1 Tax=Actinomadura nitritigenes TaxID=134602 RepID=UPI003D93B3BA